MVAQPRIQFGLFIVAAFVLRVIIARHYKVNSDETQHLHVVWGWTQGLLQYRDIFDNHSPLFQMLCAPLFALFPATPKVVISMRLAMFPLFCGSMWCIYRIVARLFSREAAAWSVVIASLYPVVFLKSVEYRTDDLWMFAWLLALERLLAVPMTRRAAFYGGLVTGISFAVSMKTVVLFATFAIAVIIVLVCSRRWRPWGDMWRILWSGAALFVLGLVLVPLAVLGFFAAQHALGELYYCVIQHNQVPGLGKPLVGWHVTKFFIWLPVLIGIATAIQRCSESPALGFRRAVLFFSASLYLIALRSFWPLVTGQDFLPLVPALVAAMVPWLLVWRDAVSARRRWIGMAIGAVPLVFALFEVKWLLAEGRPFHHQGPSRLHWLQRPLDYTDPWDFVMDAKGDTIYRHRPYYWALESVTRVRVRLGSIPDNIPQRLIETQTPIVLANRLEGDSLRFVEANYLLSSDDFYVLGQWLPDSSGAPAEITIRVPGIYRFVGPAGPIAGKVDGRLRSAPSYLKPGVHRFEPTEPQSRIAVVWAKANDRGFDPFVKSAHHAEE